MDNIQIDVETLEAAKSQLETISGAVVNDLSVILEELKKIEVTNEPKAVLDSTAQAISNALSSDSIQFPATIGAALGTIATKLGMQENNVKKAFDGWGDAFKNVVNSISGGVKKIQTALINVPEGAENYTLANAFNDVTDATVDAAVRYVDSGTKLWYGFTGQKLDTSLEAIGNQAVGSLGSIIGVISDGLSNITKLLPKRN